MTIISTVLKGPLTCLLHSMAGLVVVGLMLVLPANALPSPQNYHQVHVFAAPTHKYLNSRSTVRITCTAQGPYEAPYVSFWRLPRDYFTWLSDEDSGISIRPAGQPGNRTVTLDLWIGPAFYDQLQSGGNLFMCRGETMDNVKGFSNFTIYKESP